MLGHKEKMRDFRLGEGIKEKLHPTCLKQQDRFYSSYCSRGERLQCRTELDSKYGKDSWGFIASGQNEGVGGWKITKRNLIRYQGLGGFSLNWAQQANDEA